jgi:hypothetical protein
MGYSEDPGLCYHDSHCKACDVSVARNRGSWTRIPSRVDKDGVVVRGPSCAVCCGVVGLERLRRSGGVEGPVGWQVGEVAGCVGGQYHISLCFDSNPPGYFAAEQRNHCLLKRSTPTPRALLVRQNLRHLRVLGVPLEAIRQRPTFCQDTTRAVRPGHTQNRVAHSDSVERYAVTYLNSGPQNGYSGTRTRICAVLPLH